MFQCLDNNVTSLKLCTFSSRTKNTIGEGGEAEAYPDCLELQTSASLEEHHHTEGG